MTPWVHCVLSLFYVPAIKSNCSRLFASSSSSSSSSISQILSCVIWCLFHYRIKNRKSGLQCHTCPKSINRKLEFWVCDLHTDSQLCSLIFPGAAPQVDPVDVERAVVFHTVFVTVLIQLGLCFLIPINGAILFVLIDVFYSLGIRVCDRSFCVWIETRVLKKSKTLWSLTEKIGITFVYLSSFQRQTVIGYIVAEQHNESSG